MEVRKGQHVRVELPDWLMRKNGMASRSLVGSVEIVSAKQFFLKGHADLEGSDRCHRCGLTITNPASLLVGYGPDCCAYLGIPRDFDPGTLAQVREAAKVKTTGGWWLPTSYVKVETLADSPAGEAFVPPPDRATVFLKSDRMVVTSPIRYKDKLKFADGSRAEWDKSVTPNRFLGWSFPASVWAVATVTEALKGCEIDWQVNGLREKAEALKGNHLVKQETEDALAPFETKTKPWLHQARAYHFCKNLDGAMLAMEMGTGKSKVAVDLVVNSGAARTLILAPKSVVNVWPKQFRVHGGRPVRVLPLGERLVRPDGSLGRKLTVKDKAALAQEALVSPEPLVIVLPYQSAIQPAWNEWSRTIAWDYVVLDESHKIKAPGGTISMYCNELGKKAKKRLCLTGTPMPHGPEDVYAQYRFLDKGIFGTSNARFKDTYLILDAWGQITGLQNEEEFNEKFYRIAFRATKDVLDLPPQVHQERYCQLGPEAAKVYRQLSDALVADIKGKKVTAANALVKLLRLRQVTSGYLPLEEGEPVVSIDTAKRALLEDVLDDIDKSEPVVVFAVFRKDLDVIKEVALASGRRYGELSGRSKDGLAVDSTMREDIDLLGVQLQAGGVGIDLTRARYCIYYSQGFSLGDYDQSLSRVHRPGQDRTTYYVHLIAESTVDEKVYRVLSDRQDVIQSILAEGRAE